MEAPGGPGAPPMWGPGRKMAFGTAPVLRSKLWYTLADGSLSEVFFPTIDHVALHELRFFASAAGAPPVDDASDRHDGDGYLTTTYERAGPGNVAVGAEIGIRAGAFTIAIGFAHTRADAEEVARATLQKGSGGVRHAFERAWRSLPDLPPALSKVSGDEGMLAQASLAALS